MGLKPTADGQASDVRGSTGEAQRRETVRIDVTELAAIAKSSRRTMPPAPSYEVLGSRLAAIAIFDRACILHVSGAVLHAEGTGGSELHVLWSALSHVVTRSEIAFASGPVTRCDLALDQEHATVIIHAPYVALLVATEAPLDARQASAVTDLLRDLP